VPAMLNQRACLTCHTFQNTCSLCHTNKLSMNAAPNASQKYLTF